MKTLYCSTVYFPARLIAPLLRENEQMEMQVQICIEISIAAI